MVYSMSVLDRFIQPKTHVIGVVGPRPIEDRVLVKQAKKPKWFHLLASMVVAGGVMTLGIQQMESSFIQHQVTEQLQAATHTQPPQNQNHPLVQAFEHTWAQRSLSRSFGAFEMAEQALAQGQALQAAHFYHQSSLAAQDRLRTLFLHKVIAKRFKLM